MNAPFVPSSIVRLSFPARRIFSSLHLIRVLAVAAAVLALSGAKVRAGDVTWNDLFGNFLWNTTDPNWSTGLWNNANGDGAIFGATGAGAISVTSPINVSSMNFTANGYTLGGAGSLTFVNGASTLGTGLLNVAASVTARINTAINSSSGLIKLGEGILELGGPMTFSGGGLSLDPRGALPTDLIVGGGSDPDNNPIYAGTIRILNSSVLPATARLGVSNGLFDFGANNITIAALNFVNQANNFVLYNPATGVAGAGVFGTGTLRVTGDISVLGVGGNNFSSNLIGSNLDLGGGTQVVRTTSNGQFALTRALGFTGVLSNGSLLHTFGVTENGVMGNPDGMALYGNNTYTGSTTLNGGPTIMTGTNATTLVKIEGDRGAAAPNGTTLTLQGANGSLGGATIIQAFAGAQFIIDNNVAIAAGGDTPTVAAAQNNNRIRDDAEMQLRDGTFIYRGLAATAGSETFGKLNLLGGHNNVTLTPGSGGGSVSVTVAGDMALAPRATLQVTSSTLGAASKMFINGTMPAADATGIISHVVGSTDFLTYNGTTGLTPYTGYAADFTTPGTNVFTNGAVASAPNSINVNAIKSTGTFATTITAGQTLGVTSGMLLNLSGTRTYTGGTIAFGSNPGVLFAGTTGSGGFTISSAITGTAGLINANSVSTLSGDLSGLTGTITNDVGFATTTLNTNTFAGAIEIRGGTFNLNTSQTLAGQGAITIGVPANDAHLINNFAQLNFSGAGAGAIIGRDIIVDNGSNDAAGLAVVFGFLPSLAPLSNSTGSQTLSGNITLNSPARLQGGGGGGTGATTLSGNISGPAQFFLSNGRETLSGSYSNAGGFRVGEQGFTAQVTFTGTPIGSAPIVFEGGNNSLIAYNSGSLPNGTITVEGASGGFTASLNPLQNSTINNPIVLGTAAVPGGAINSNVASGVTANWNGQISGTGGLTKATGTGTLVLGNAANTYTGATTVSAGTLLVNGSSASSLHTVASTATLGGNGSVGPVTVNSGGTLSPGSSIGTFGTGNLSLSGTFLSEINLNNGGAASADLLNLTGTFSITGGVLMLSLTNLPNPSSFAGETILLVANDGADAISGTFSSISGVPAGFSATVDYAFSGTDALGRTGNGNDLAVRVVPEPTTYALIALGAPFFAFLRRKQR